MPVEWPTARPKLMVTADDCTGALETAASCADVGWPTLMSRTTSADASGCVVFDLATRHLHPEDAAARVGAVAATYRVDAHKIDSTLRGNWDAEVMAYVRSGRRVLLVPAHPAAGRTCSDGIVRVNGVPVHESEHGDDRRSMTRTSRPSTVLVGSVEVSGSQVGRWVADRRGPAVAIADATTVRELEIVMDAVASEDPAVMVCGPSAAIRALAARRSPHQGLVGASGSPVLRLPVLVVVGSRHQVSRAQVASLASSNAFITVLTTDPDEETDPEHVANTLASRAHRALAAQRFPTVVLVGGDTAGAFLGERSVRVFGSLELGVAQGVVVIDGVEVAVVAKPGAFGDETTLVRLIAEMSP
ncbi:MAG: hypothetical protein RLZZ623_213 [Actinomycetota bacterium]